MAFAEDLTVFLDEPAGFAVAATLDGNAVSLLFDAPGADVLDGQVATTEPSAVLPAADAISSVGKSLVLSGGTLPAQLAHLAGTYSVRSAMPEPPDGVFVRLFLAKV